MPRSALALALALAPLLGAMGCTTAKDTRRFDVREAPDEPWRQRRPPAGPRPVTPLPTLQKTELKNGLTVIVVEDHGLPTIDAALVVRAGSALDGRELGVSTLTWDLLDEGAGTFHAAGLDNAFAEVGSQITSIGGRDSGALEVRFLKQHADRVVELMALVLQKPTFAAVDFDRLKRLQLDALKAREGDPDALALQVLEASVFGADHPYGAPIDGTTASVEKIKLASVKRFWSENFGPKHAVLVLAGDVTLEEARALAEKHLGRWRGAAKPVKQPPPPKPRTGMQVVVVDTPGAQQTRIRIGRALLPAGDPEEPAMIVLNQVLGGMFSSRLNLKLREEKQWTYGAFSSLEPRMGVGPFVVGADVETAATMEALVEMLAQLDALRTGVTEDELALGRAAYSRSLPALFALPPAQVELAADLFVRGLPLDHPAKIVEGVNGATGEQVKAAAMRAVVPDDLVIVLVGDRAVFETALKERDLGTLTVLNRDGSTVR
jgi:predicted Zn-dependent peptidase